MFVFFNSSKVYCTKGLPSKGKVFFFLIDFELDFAGTTAKKIIKMLNKVGVKEVHVRIASPPVTHSCYYGLDTPTKKELIASQYTEQEVCDYIGATSLKHISMKALYKAVGSKKHCDACFTGNYPVEKAGVV